MQERKHPTMFDFLGNNSAVACITENKQTASKANGLLYGRTLNRSAVSVGVVSDLETLMGLDGTALLMLQQATQYRLNLLAVKC